MTFKKVFDIVSLTFENLDKKYYDKIPYVYAILGSLSMALASLVTKHMH